MPLETVVSQPSPARSIKERYARLKELNPVGGENVDPYAVRQPAEEKGIVTLVWARRDSVIRKKAKYRAELVPASEWERYGFSPDQADKVNNWITHAFDKAVVLMRYPNPDVYDLRMLTPAFIAVRSGNDAINEFNRKASESTEPGERNNLVVFDKAGRRVRTAQAPAILPDPTAPVSLTNSRRSINPNELTRLAAELSRD
jgi:hypothetical protein